MSGNTPTFIPRKSQDAIVQFGKACYNQLNVQFNLREQYRQIDLAYIRENDFTQENYKARLSNRLGDPTKFQNVVVPVVMPQVEAAVTYQSSVFLTGTPLFGWVSDPQHESAALQYQAITEENSIRGGWSREIQIFFRDCFKYNLGILECVWDRKVTAAIETDIGFVRGTQGKPKEVIWSGNCIRRWDPYNTFWDTRYKPTDIYKDGEFCGMTQIMSRVHLKKFINELPDKMIANIITAFESGTGNISTATSSLGGAMSYYLPQINPNTNLQDPNLSFDWMSWAGMLNRPQDEIQYKNFYEVTTLYARIIPKDFLLNVPSRDTPQIWKFIFVNHEVLIYAERQTNAHAFLPTFFGQPNEDGLGYQTKSLASNAQPFQEIGSALVNSAMAARRRAISDRGIYNPALISAAHINNDSPTAKIPMRPAAYLKNPNEAYFPIPFRDDQSGIAFQELPQMLQMANTVNGQNQAKQGQFVKGNKTLREYESVMANANGRDQVTSMLLEAQVFTPLKEVLKINILQYQAGIDIFSPSQNAVIKIDPIQLRKSFVTYKITDGLTPTDKLISGDELAVALQTIATSPQIGAAYNVGPLFSYLMKTRNADLSPFEKGPEQQAYEQAMSVWQNAVIQIAKQNPEATQNSFPPQPTPQQYGYTPGMSNSQSQATPQAGNNLTQSAQARAGAQ